MQEYIIYVLLVFLPMGGLMTYLLNKEGLAKRNLAIIVSLSLLIVITFPVSMVRIGTFGSFLTYVLVILVMTRFLLGKSEELDARTKGTLVTGAELEEILVHLEKRKDQNLASFKVESFNDAQIGNDFVALDIFSPEDTAASLCLERGKDADEPDDRTLPEFSSSNELGEKDNIVVEIAEKAKSEEIQEIEEVLETEEKEEKIEEKEEKIEEIEEIEEIEVESEVETVQDEEDEEQIEEQDEVEAAEPIEDSGVESSAEVEEIAEIEAIAEIEEEKAIVPEVEEVETEEAIEAIETIEAIEIIEETDVLEIITAEPIDMEKELSGVAEIETEELTELGDDKDIQDDERDRVVVETAETIEIAEPEEIHDIEIAAETEEEIEVETEVETVQDEEDEEQIEEQDEVETVEDSGVELSAEVEEIEEEAIAAEIEAIAELKEEKAIVTDIEELELEEDEKEDLQITKEIEYELTVEAEDATAVIDIEPPETVDEMEVLEIDAVPFMEEESSDVEQIENEQFEEIIEAEEDMEIAEKAEAGGLNVAEIITPVSADSQSELEIAQEYLPQPYENRIVKLIDQGFAYKESGRLQEACECFQEAWDLTSDDELKYLLGFELLCIFESDDWVNR